MEFHFDLSEPYFYIPLRLLIFVVKICLDYTKPHFLASH